ncbi:hypothetical protein BGX34_001840, partial [Mortierella sp. NVP85]
AGPSTFTRDLERKRRAEELSPPEVKKRRWDINGAIKFKEAQSVYYVDPADTQANADIVQSVEQKRFVMLLGARASGKTTRLLRLVHQLADKGYRCFFVSLELAATCEDRDTFWASLGSFLRANKREIRHIENKSQFLSAFTREAWEEGEKIVILIDEFDLLYEACLEVREDYLRTFRGILQSEDYVIDSIIVCGTFNLWGLTTTGPLVSPFNISTRIENSYFTLESTQSLFKAYENDEQITIDDTIVRDVFFKSNGHPGMICLCGRAIHANLRFQVNSLNNLDFSTWEKFSTPKLNDHIISYNTFKRIVDSLLADTDTATTSVRLIQEVFAGRLDAVQMGDMEKTSVDFLTAEGVLLRIDEGKYSMASPLIDTFIRQYVIPKRFPNEPLTPIPLQHHNDHVSMDVVEALKMAVKGFNGGLFRLNHSYKSSGNAKVDGGRYKNVPRESVYDNELLRIFTNWFRSTLGGYQVTGQWHSRDVHGHKYSDIVISKDDKPTVVLEILATACRPSILDHFQRTIDYKDLLEANIGWVIHFTRQDDYLDEPDWPSDAQLEKGVGLVHFWHDQNYTTLRMIARSKVKDEAVEEVVWEHLI